MEKAAKRRAFVRADFTDNGTGQSFKKGALPTLPEGQFLNYEAAGLVQEYDATRAAKAKPKT